MLNEKNIGYADFRGNKQFLSVGNLASDDKIMLFLMDYAHQERLKIWGRARVSEDPEVIQRLQMPDYPAKVERAILIGIEAFDWNCSQHIPQRFTLEER